MLHITLLALNVKLLDLFVFCYGDAITPEPDFGLSHRVLVRSAPHYGRPGKESTYLIFKSGKDVTSWIFRSGEDVTSCHSPQLSGAEVT